MAASNFRIIEGDLLDQPVEAIVNSWNRNIIPWWLLLPQGVSGAIKRQAGIQPFREVARVGSMKLGQAVLTSAGRLPYKGIIHVAGINLLWRGSEYSIRESTKNALQVAFGAAFKSMAFSLIGTGSGGFSEASALAIMQDEIERSTARLDEVWLVRFKKPTSP
jgi:O-acetyl-ADP-ribose deacetylase (regulator of RNase III)